MPGMRKCLLAACAVFALALPSQAIIGVGVHWGFDWSLSMDNVPSEQMTIDNLKLTGLPMAPAGFDTVPSVLLPIYIGRTDFDRTVVNFGDKVLIDAIKWFAIELSANFGMWEYEGVVIYPRTLQFRTNPDPNPDKPGDLFTIAPSDFDTLAITCDQLNVKYLGLDKTPYAKLNIDLTVRKNIFAIPKKLKTWSLYAGAGASVNFATPMLSAQLVEDALGKKVERTFDSLTSLGSDFLGDSDVMKAVLDEIVAGLTVPKWGMHILLGTQVKVPVIPLAFYVDGKFMIPFGDLDPYVDLKGYGFLVNAGVMLKF
jgi:hypothetical protein